MGAAHSCSGGVRRTTLSRRLESSHEVLKRALRLSSCRALSLTGFVLPSRKGSGTDHDAGTRVGSSNLPAS